MTTTRSLPLGVTVIAREGVRVMDESVARAAQAIAMDCADLVVPATLRADGRYAPARPWSPVTGRYTTRVPPVLIAADGWAPAAGGVHDFLMGPGRRARIALSDIPVAVEPEAPSATVPPVRPMVSAVDGSALVSVVIPTRDHPELLDMAHRTIARAGWDRVDAIFVDNGTTDPHALALLDRSVHRVLRAPIAFNFARLVNRGAAHARGEYIVLLNNDVEALAEGWLASLLDPLADPDVGVVGSTLLYPSGRVQHCGVALADGVPVHAFAGRRENDLPLDVRTVPGERTAVTGACMAVRTTLWRQLGGMADALATNYNDVDFCLRARRSGARIACTPDARLVHHESESRGRLSTPDVAADWLLFRSRWGAALSEPDPWMEADA